MGFEDVQVAEGRRIASGFSFFVVYASTPQAIDFSTIKAPSAKTHAMSMEEVDAFVNERLGRKVRVAGACIGTDAHTVGIDAILNMKGYKGDYGLERYHAFETFNLGSQVAVEDLVRFAKEKNIDAILASQSSRRRGATCGTLRPWSNFWKPRIGAIASLPSAVVRGNQSYGQRTRLRRGLRAWNAPSEVASFIALRLADAQRSRAREDRARHRHNRPGRFVLAELLLREGYRVVGMTRRTSTDVHERIAHWWTTWSSSRAIC